MRNYLVRFFAGGAIGYVFGLSVGCVLIVRNLLGNPSASPVAAESSVAMFLLSLSTQSALIGCISGAATGRTKGWGITWRSMSAGALSGLGVVLLLVALLGWRNDPTGEYMLVAASAQKIAAVNLAWGLAVGLVVGLVLLPFNRVPAPEDSEDTGIERPAAVEQG